jgi:hypothetical protein
MFGNDSDRKLTRKERLAVVLAIGASLAFHLLLFAGSGGVRFWAEKEKKRERLMVIRQVRDVAPPPDLKESSPRRPQMQAHVQPLPPEPAHRGPEAKSGGAAPAPPPTLKPKVSDRGIEPPKGEQELTEKMVEDVREAEEKPKQEEKAAGELAENTLSVVTDLGVAAFTVAGPQEYRGSGTFWLRKGAPAGRYTVSFSPVAGYATPPPQSKELVMRGQIVFVGKYRKSHEIVVNANHPEAQFTIFRPDGRPLDMKVPGRALFDDLPSGNYTIVFKDLPGYVTPAPLVRNFAGGGELAFSGEYRADGKGAGGQGTGQGTGSGAGSGLGASGTGGWGGGGRGSGRGDRKPVETKVDAGLDRRVQMVVKSYPKTAIEENYDPIPYPTRIISRSDFQKGWCQVYLVIAVGESGEIQKISVERPKEEDRAPYEELIAAVEKAVRGWDYDKVAAEINVDVRFYVE